MNQEVFAALAEALERGEEVALVTIVAAHGSTPQRVGAKMLVYPDGRTVGTIGGGCYENDAFWKAREAITQRRPRERQVRAERRLRAGDRASCAEGRWKSSSNRSRHRPTSTCSAPGTSAISSRSLRTRVGFRVHVIDDREKFASSERFGEGIDVVVDNIPQWLATHTLPPTAYAVIVTRGHTHDLDALRALTAAPLRYLGLIGSKAKVRRIFDALVEEGTPPTVA